MPIASFQRKVFQVSATKKYTLDAMSWNGSLETEAQEKLDDKPSTYIKGLGLDSLSFEIPLRADFGVNARSEIEQWEKIRDGRKPDRFILGSKPLGNNKWLLKSVSVDDLVIDTKGRILKANLKLDFEEYVRAGKDTSTTTNSTSGLNVAPDDYIYEPTDKADKKRDNPNYTASLQTLAVERRLNQGE